VGDDELERAQVMVRMHALTEEALADYAARGIPKEEVSDNDLFAYIFGRLTNRELAALGLPAIPPDEEKVEEWTLAMVAYHTQVLAQEGKIPAKYADMPLGIDDPEKEERVRGLMQYFRKQDEERAYWGVDNDPDDSEDPESE
jgi:hypothetical protein